VIPAGQTLSRTQTFTLALTVALYALDASVARLTKDSILPAAAGQAQPEKENAKCDSEGRSYLASSSYLTTTFPVRWIPAKGWYNPGQGTF